MMECSLKSAQVGDIITFGQYPQNNNKSPEPIEWLVLDNDGRNLLVISKYGLDCKDYHDECFDEVTWETCTLRHWLNSTFLQKAFNSEEQALIKFSHLVNSDNPQFETSGGASTEDQLFCLSISEAEQYLARNSHKTLDESGYYCTYENYDDLLCIPSAYAVFQGVEADDDNGNCWYWLRTPGEDPQDAAAVNHLGNVVIEGDTANSGILAEPGGNAVRPAMRLKL